MTAYVVADIDVTDTTQYERYKALSPGAVAAAGGRFVARGGTVAPLEGGWTPTRLVIIEFPDLAAAKRFYDSPLYREARNARDGAARCRMFAVEGL
jgi:uncharacterized protein (DUF1330 family)